MIAIVGRIDSGARSTTSRMSLAQVGRAAVAAGATVEAVGVVAEGPAGDHVLGELAGDGVAHAAVLRTAAESLDAADLGLALRYLPDLRVVVLLDVSAALVPAALEGAAFSGAAVVVTVEEALPAGLPNDAIVLQAPTGGAAGSFAEFVGHLAGRLDAGVAAADAWTDTVAALGVDPASGRVASAP